MLPKIDVTKYKEALDLMNKRDFLRRRIIKLRLEMLHDQADDLEDDLSDILLDLKSLLT